MKFYRNLLIVIIIVVAGILILRSGSPNLVKPPSDIPPTTALSPSPPAQPVQPVANVPATPAPAGTVPPQPTADTRSKIFTLAQSVGVNVMSYAENGKTVTVALDWASDSIGPGTDFLDEGVKQGIVRDFKELTRLSEYYSGGRRHYRVSYEVYLY